MKGNLLAKMSAKLPTSVTRSLAKTKMTLKVKSPELLIIAGAAGFAASIFTACKASFKVDDILDEAKETIDKIHEVANNPDFADKYSEEDKKKDLTIAYVKTGVKFIKIYAPTAIIFGLSLASILNSNRIMKQRNAALMTAYAGLERAYKEYRNRVVERFGKDADYEMEHGIKAIEIEEKTTDPKTGKEITEKKTEYEYKPGPNPYAFLWDEYCKNHCSDPLMAYSYYKCQLKYLNDKLIAEGYLFLNEVYRAFGAPETEAGQIVGWIYDKRDGSLHNKIDFGVDDVNNIGARDFRDGKESCVWLYPNVDGIIVNKFMKYTN